MRFVLCYTKGSLSPIGDRLLSEGHQVSNGSLTTNGTLLISDVPKDPMLCNGEGIGISRFTLLMTMSKAYEATIKIAANLPSGDLDSKIEYSLGCWFNGIDFVFPVFGIVDDNYFMGRDRGYPALMGSTIKIFREPPEVFMNTIWKLKSWLRSANFRGFVMVDCNEVGGVVNIYPHFRTDSIYATLEATQEEVGRMLVEISNGSKKNIRCCRNEYAIAVRISVPPYPYPQWIGQHILMGSHDKIKGYCKSNAKHIWLREVEKDVSGERLITGGIVGAITARGDNINECRRRAYRTISNLDIQWLQFRQDIGIRAEEILPNLK
jgi:hypothetical protein